jgi:hypothetical protein
MDGGGGQAEWCVVVEDWDWIWGSKKDGDSEKEEEEGLGSERVGPRAWGRWAARKRGAA